MELYGNMEFVNSYAKMSPMQCNGNFELVNMELYDNAYVHAQRKYEPLHLRNIDGWTFKRIMCGRLMF